MTGVTRYTMKVGDYILPLILLVSICLLQLSCEKDDPKPVIETSTMTDIDGNVYTTIKIGNQWWMAENLKVETYRDGSPITQSQSVTNWQKGNPSFTIFNNNEDSPGLLYNWYAVNSTNGLAPEGWHIPTDEEWMELEKSLGMSTDEANKSGWRGTNESEKMRIEGTQGWTRYEEVWPTNESGFAAEAGACRLFNGTWCDPGLFHTGYWWATTEMDSKEAWFRYLDYKSPEVFRFYTNKNYGFSVRCVKDK